MGLILSPLGIPAKTKILIDDIIGYLAPSLEAYKGCTVIDVHPGACLWSSKLHDFLKPKRHVLMEPEMLYYDAFMKPLLDQPGSTYRHTTLVGSHPREYWDNYRQIFEDKDLVGQPALHHDDPKLREINTNILLTGNLWRKYPIQHKSSYVDSSTLLLQHMTWTALTNDIFHQSGLVRQLWWVPDEKKRSIFPTAVRGKRGYDSGLTMGASITEVAGISRIESCKRAANAESPRSAKMDAVMLGRVEHRMAENGLEIPPGRKMPKVMEAIKVEDDVHTTDSIMTTSCTTITKLKAAIKKFDTWLKNLQVQMVKDQLDGRAKTMPSPERIEELLKKYVRYRQSIDAVESRRPFSIDFIANSAQYVRVVVIKDMEARLINLEAEYAAVRDKDPDPEALAACRDAILASGKLVAHLNLKVLGERRRDNSGALIDDILSAESRPSTIHRDRRPYEPLQARAEEFWPQYELALLDITPDTRDLSAPGIANRREGTKICQELLKYLFHSPKMPVTVALERIAPNAAQDLIPEVPAITDARRGGRLDPGTMSVRMLTPEMVEGLVKAFLEWPFRPSTVELALAQDAGVAQEDDETDGEIH